MPPVPNHLVSAILATLFCCLPFGVIAIVYASQVNAKQASGDYEGALQASKTANMWVWIAAGCGIGVGVLYALVAVVAAA